MQKTIFITGSGAGLGYATAKMLLSQGHNVIVHARNDEKVNVTIAKLSQETGVENIKGYACDLSVLKNVKELADQIIADNQTIDVLINNAGVFNVKDTRTADNLDVRFAVNVIAPYLLTSEIMPMLSDDGRVVNLSSAAQTYVNIDALTGRAEASADTAYAMSKVAIIIWTNYLADKYKDTNKVFVSINPKSFLGTNMVKEAYGSDGVDVNIGARILTAASLDDDFNNKSGMYFDNDRGLFAQPHPDALDAGKSKQVMSAITDIINEKA